jgi:small subunit ribosomal protein S4e
MHLKRQKVPKSWPITRKGTKYLVRPNSDIHSGIPILIILRDMLKIAQNRREVKRAIHEKNILLNNKKVTDEKNVAKLFDIVSIVPSKKNYKMIFSQKGKFELEEIKNTELNKKIVKIVNKKTVKKKKVQINLSDGRNFISDIKCNVGDSAVINFTSNKIDKIIEFKEKNKVVVIAGNHIGEQGIITKINKEMKMAEISINKNSANILIKQIMVVE